MFIAEIIAYNRGIQDAINGEDRWVFEDDIMDIAYRLGHWVVDCGISVKYLTSKEAKFSRLRTILMLGDDKHLRIKTNKVSDGYEGYVCSVDEGFENILVRTPWSVPTKAMALAWIDLFICELKAKVLIEGL